jgi:hypothetical protein
MRHTSNMVCLLLVPQWPQPIIKSVTHGVNVPLGLLYNGRRANLSVSPISAIVTPQPVIKSAMRVLKAHLGLLCNGRRALPRVASQMYANRRHALAHVSYYFVIRDATMETREFFMWARLSMSSSCSECRMAMLTNHPNTSGDRFFSAWVTHPTRLGGMHGLELSGSN